MRRKDLILARYDGLICQQCDEKFYPTNKRGPIPKFCCGACKQKSWRESQGDFDLVPGRIWSAYKWIR